VAHLSRWRWRSRRPPEERPCLWKQHALSVFEAQLLTSLADRPATVQGLAARLDLSLTRLRIVTHKLRARNVLRRTDRGLEVVVPDFAEVARALTLALRV
jgi:hypothetical protein